MDDGLTAQRREGIDLAGLAAVSGHLASGNPLLVHKPAKQRVHDIVVHVVLSEKQGGLFFQGVAVLGTFEEKSED